MLIGLGALGVLVGGALILLGVVGAVFWKRPREGCCPACGYSLQGLGGERCPECGWVRPLSPGALARIMDRLGLDRADRLMTRGGILMAAGGGLVLLGW